MTAWKIKSHLGNSAVQQKGWQLPKSLLVTILAWEQIAVRFSLLNLRCVQWLENTSLRKVAFMSSFLWREYIFWAFIVLNNNSNLEQSKSLVILGGHVFSGTHKTVSWYQRPWRKLSLGTTVKPKSCFSDRNLCLLSPGPEEAAGCCWRGR